MNAYQLFLKSGATFVVYTTAKLLDEHGCFVDDIGCTEADINREEIVACIDLTANIKKEGMWRLEHKEMIVQARLNAAKVDGETELARISWAEENEPRLLRFK